MTGPDANTPSDQVPSFEPVALTISGFWRSASLGAAIEHNVFDLLEKFGPMSSGQLAERANISTRGARLLLDALCGCQLVEVEDNLYRNSPASKTYLVRGSDMYLGSLAKLFFEQMPSWIKLPNTVTSGVPFMDPNESPVGTFWLDVAKGIRPLSASVVLKSMQVLGVKDRLYPKIMDVGGGLAAFSEGFLRSSDTATCTQIDWPHVNREARLLLGELGFGNRFDTLDGDMLKVTLQAQEYDIAVYSLMMHGFSKEENEQMFGRIFRSLKPGGSLLVQDYFLEDNGSGHPFSKLFSAEVLANSLHGEIWSINRAVQLLELTGFCKVQVMPTATPTMLMVAKKP